MFKSVIYGFFLSLMTSNCHKGEVALVPSNDDPTQPDILLAIGCSTEAQADSIRSGIRVVSDDYYKSNIRQITIEYPSVDTQGLPVTLSGSIFFHKSAERFDEIIASCHPTANSDDDVPSGSTSIAYMDPLLCSDQRTTVVIASDYLGFGSSTDRMHPYLNHGLCARNEIDMLRAALVYLFDQNYTFSSNYHTYIEGFSQGGAVAMATLRAIEKDSWLADNLHLVGSFCAEGPYSLTTTFDYYFSRNADLGNTSFLLPYVILGMMESYPEDFQGIKCEDYFSQPVIDSGIIEALRHKNSLTDLMKYTKKYDGTIYAMMSTSAQSLDSDIMQILMRCLQRQELCDGSWHPQRPILLYHSTEDTVVPYVNCEAALRAFANDSTIHPTDWPLGKNHPIEMFNVAGLLRNGAYRVLLTGMTDE